MTREDAFQPSARQRTTIVSGISSPSGTPDSIAREPRWRDLPRSSVSGNAARHGNTETRSDKRHFLNRPVASAPHLPIDVGGAPPRQCSLTGLGDRGLAAGRTAVKDGAVVAAMTDGRPDARTSACGGSGRSSSWHSRRRARRIPFAPIDPTNAEIADEPYFAPPQAGVVRCLAVVGAFHDRPLSCTAGCSIARAAGGGVRASGRDQKANRS